MKPDYIKLLITSAKQGKKNAFRELANINLKKIYNIAVRLLLNEKVAEVVTQDIFIEAWNNLNFLRDELMFEVWLKGIAIYKLLDELRTQTVKKRLLEEGIVLPTTANVTSTDKTENTILQLPEKKRIAFILHGIEKYTYEEISDFIYDMTANDIKKMVRETRKEIISLNG